VIRATTLLSLLAGLALAGCQDPYSDRAQPNSTRTSTAEPSRDDTAAAGPVPAPLVRHTTHRPLAARVVARSFAARWVNWDWRTAARQQRALSRYASAELGRTLRANAGSARIDASLARDQPGSRGTVVAIDLKRTHSRVAGVVVTHEQTYTRGHADLGGQRYRVYLIELEPAHGRWEVKRWAPQP
jgi:hypothetical protein